jgi:cytochrome c-type biogenesis protein CcmH/NrfG
LAVSGRNRLRRFGSGAALAAVLVLSILGATVARPWVNFSGDVGQDFADKAYRALVEDKPERAAPLLERAVAVDPKVAGWWFNLGIAYNSLQRPEESLRAFRHALELEPHNAKYKAVVWQAKLKVKTQEEAPDSDSPPADDPASATK